VESQFGYVCVVADEGGAQLEWCLKALRAACPNAPAVVISDGVNDPTYPEICKRYAVRYVLGAYYKRVECGGRWWRRTFEAGLRLETEWLVKIDPDTRVWRPFQAVPTTDVAGTVTRWGHSAFATSRSALRENVQGGCQLIKASAARELLASGHLDSPDLKHHYAFALSDQDYRNCKARAYLSTDRTLMWLVNRAGLTWGDWSEVNCVWRAPAPENEGLRYAATHPHKLDIASGPPGVPLHVVTTCKGRLDHLKQTLPRWLAEPDVTVTVVDYDCPHGTTQWVRENHPEVQIVEARGLPKFNLSAARNLGAKYAPDGWLCFLDADCLTSEGWSEEVRKVLRPRHYYLADPIDWGQFGSVVVHSDDFKAAGGYDENFRAWGNEDSDLYLRLRHCGARPDSMPSRYFQALEHTVERRVEFYDVKSKDASRLFYEQYVRRKGEHMLATGLLPTLEECLLFLELVYEAFTYDSMDLVALGPGQPPQLPSSVVVHSPSLPEASPVEVTHVPAIPAALPTLHAPKVVIVNKSSVISDSQGQAWTKALQVQVDRDFYPAWYTRADLTFIPRNHAIPLGVWVLYLLDDSDQAGALGYHDKTADDMPLGKVFCRTTQQDGGLVSVTVSHELLEMLGDPFINRTIVTGDGSRFYAYENCDACEDDKYAYAVQGIPLSDFVYPEYFDDADTRGKFDHQGHISRPLEILPGGYLGYCDAGSNGWQQVTADGVPHKSSLARYTGNRYHRRKAGRAAHVRAHGHAARADLGVRV
jgi:hypothetical protein